MAIFINDLSDGDSAENGNYFTEASSGSSLDNTPEPSLLPSSSEEEDKEEEEATPTAPESAQAGDGSENPVMDARAYQREMFEQSLRRNAVVVMPTGSGKTQVALLRIRHEIETGSPDKLIWFIAPTVILCSQHFDVISLQMPSVASRLLTGNDNVDSWTAPLWRTVLSESRIVVSTPKVLHDALCHAFVRMDNLALLIFDEAHNCVGKDAGSKVMDEFYHPSKQTSSPVPAILGLTASPSISSKLRELEMLEKILDARCITPTLHRQELLRYVKKPRISCISYILQMAPDYSVGLNSLGDVCNNLDLDQDPYVRRLAANPTERNQRLLQKVMKTRKTYAQEQLRGLHRNCGTISLELGRWAADKYLYRVINEFLDQVKAGDLVAGMASSEKAYLEAQLLQVVCTRPAEHPDKISRKVRQLIDCLVSATESPVCIIFAKERSTVSMLYEVLTNHPEVTDRYRIGTIVGTSNNRMKKRNIYEIASGQAGLSSLQKFRSGKINLLIATSVLEEGIDVPACNLVICFDRIISLKAFVQRRGRARMRDSQLILFMEDSGEGTKQWESMEAEMKRQYEDEEREWKMLQDLEESEQPGHAFFEVESTRARIGMDDAKQHLEHFCRTLSRGEFVDARPDYLVEREEGDDSIVVATVVLPPFVPAHIRRITGNRIYRTEKNATKDAALQAYIALYNEGLVNDNLLPFRPDQIPGVETRSSLAPVSLTFNPWPQIAQAWGAGEPCYGYTYVCVDHAEQIIGQYEVILPVAFESLRPMKIFKDYDHVWNLLPSSGRLIPVHEMETMQDHAPALLAFHFAHRFEILDRKHIIRVRAHGIDISEKHIGSRPFEPQDALTGYTTTHLIRDNTGAPYLYEDTLPSKPPSHLVRHPFIEYEDAPQDVPYLLLKKWTRRADFLHPLHSDPKQGQASTRPYGSVWPLHLARIDTLPHLPVQFGLFIPSIIHELEVMLVAKRLSETLIRPLALSNLHLVREAICATSAQEPTNYERLEFLGDSILKYCAAILGVYRHPLWPEGYLSHFKDQLVSNGRLSRACLDKGLAQYIITKPFTGQKWRPLYLDDFLEQQVNEDAELTRKLSTKTLADVVESLIGASYQDGGIEKARQCIGLFIDEQIWPDIDTMRESIYQDQPVTAVRPESLVPLETLLGYTFKKKSLLVEAVTHASFTGTDEALRTWERLEYLGDAVLDMIIVTRLYAKDPSLRHYQMHMIKTAMVNSDFLAFISMEHQLPGEETVVSEDLELTTKRVSRTLCSFIRHQETAVALEQAALASRHKDLRMEILEALETGTHYPWSLLARLRARKLVSDMVEATLGAMWVDSRSLDECEQYLTRLGILPCMERMIRDGVEMQHPKEMLGMCAGSRTVRYETEELVKPDAEREYTCTVYVGDEIVVSVRDGVTKEEVKTKAAMETVKILKMQGED